MLDPLDVGLGIAVDLADELGIAAHHGRGVGGEPRLQDGPVRGALCEGTAAGQAHREK